MSSLQLLFPHKQRSKTQEKKDKSTLYKFPLPKKAADLWNTFFCFQLNTYLWISELYQCEWLIFLKKVDAKKAWLHLWWVVLPSFPSAVVFSHAIHWTQASGGISLVVVQVGKGAVRSPLLHSNSELWKQTKPKGPHRGVFTLNRVRDHFRPCECAEWKCWWVRDGDRKQKIEQQKCVHFKEKNASLSGAVGGVKQLSEMTR